MKKSLFFPIALIFTFILIPFFCWSLSVPSEQTKLTDDLYIEIKAQINFAADQAFKKYKGMEAVNKAEEAYAKIYEKYGVTKEELEAYLTEISEKDVNRATDIVMKVARRTQELASEVKTEPVPVSGESSVKGFPGVPLYPGAESIAGTQMGDTEWALEQLKEEGLIWYEYSEKLCDEYNNDPSGVNNRILDFYKDKFSQKGWEYIGEGVMTHHWVNGDAAIGISFPADCSIEYINMHAAEARGNCGELEENQFIEAIFTCAQKSQDVCKESGIQSSEDFMNCMSDEESYENLRKKIEDGLNQTLVPYGVTYKRFQEIKKGLDFDAIMGRIYSENQEKLNSLQLGFMVLMDMIQ